MPANPDTRESLILRLPSANDADAWQEFIDLYKPLVIRFARRRGLQDADAREIAQNVFISVAKAVALILIWQFVLPNHGQPVIKPLSIRSVAEQQFLESQSGMGTHPVNPH